MVRCWKEELVPCVGRDGVELPEEGCGPRFDSCEDGAAAEACAAPAVPFCPGEMGGGGDGDGDGGRSSGLTLLLRL